MFKPGEIFVRSQDAMYNLWVLFVQNVYNHCIFQSVNYIFRALVNKIFEILANGGSKKYQRGTIKALL